jgi:hypothetical protein
MAIAQSLSGISSVAMAATATYSFEPFAISLKINNGDKLYGGTEAASIYVRAPHQLRLRTSSHSRP